MAISEIVFISEVAFLLGVGAASLPFVSWSIPILIIALAVFSYRYGKSLRIVLLSVIFLIVGFSYMNLYREAIHSNIPTGERLSMSGIVSSEPKVSGSYMSVTLQTERGEIVLRASPLLDINYGDTVDFSGIAKSSEDGGVYVSFPNIKSIEPGRGYGVKSSLIAIKDYFLKPLRRYLSIDAAALASGMAFGVRSDFPSELREAMQKSGTMHIVALSGYNISILILAIGIAMKKFSKKTRMVTASILILLFVIMTGAEKSVVRAAIMGFILLLAQDRGRVYSPKFALAFTAFIMVLIDPRILVFDLGFELSFLSLIGVVVIGEKLMARIDLNEPGIMGWKENVATTLSAQLAVAPLLMYKFGTVSIIGLVTNILILELVPLTMFLTFIFALIAGILPHLSQLLSLVLEALLRFHLFVIKAGAALPYSSTKSWIFAAAAYLIFGIILFINAKPKIQFNP